MESIEIRKIMTYPLVTIGIPTYNRTDSYLKEAIQSALDQTYPNLEIFISDNCSSDNTGFLVKSFTDPRIRYHRHDVNIGGNNNFNYCVEKARGIYFLLLHDDDLIDADFIEVCMRAANYKEDAGIIRTGMRRIDSDGMVIGEKENLVGGLSTTDFFIGWFKGKTPMHLCSTLFNTQRLKEIGGFNSKHNLFQDVIAEVILAAKFGQVDVRDIKASFRNHPSQRTDAAEIKAWCEDSLILLDTICRLAAEDKKMLRSKGLRFFSNHNYLLADKIESPIKRFYAHLKIFRLFGYQMAYLRKCLRGQINRIRETS
jgi:glycosyltransferase involved in cell wall biosynthesis